MFAAASAFDSLTGRRGVDIGTSFTRAWNERTGKTTKRSKDYPNPEYYSLRYKFKPESIDNEAAGTLTPKGGDERAFELELPSLQHGDSHRFTAVEQPPKEWECVLLWDPATQQLTLEKLESTLNLNYDGRGKGTLATSATPPPAAGPSRIRRPHLSATAHNSGLEDDLEKTLTGYSDAEGELDDDMGIQAEIEAIAGVTHRQEEEEEEEDGEEEAEAEEEEEEEEEEEMERVDVDPPPPPPPQTKLKAPHRAPVKTTTKAKSKARARPSTNARGEVDGIEEEELNFGEPTKRTRHPRRSSTAHNPNAGNTGLTLPAPHAQNRHAPPTPSDLLRPPPTRVVYAGSESGSESDESDEGGEVDAAALERELELELAEEEPDDDETMEVYEIESRQHDSGRPLSLNEMFAEQSQGDDDTTSDDSDDD